MRDLAYSLDNMPQIFETIKPVSDTRCLPSSTFSDDVIRRSAWIPGLLLIVSPAAWAKSPAGVTARPGVTTIQYWDFQAPSCAAHKSNQLHSPVKACNAGNRYLHSPTPVMISITVQATCAPTKHPGQTLMAASP